MNLKVGDKVIVIAGKDKGKEGKIIAKKGEKVLVTYNKDKLIVEAVKDDE